MSTALKQTMTRDEFLVWVEDQDGRWEYDGFQPVAMTGGSRAHSRITANVIIAVGRRLRGSDCAVFTSDLAITPLDSVRYPDAFVACGASLNTDQAEEAPVVVFEVLSPSTASVDQITKNAEYRSLPSIQRYLMLAQDRIAATIFARQGGAWVGTLITDEDAILDMPEIGIEVALAEFYEGVIAPA